jgi:hypothetical protein
MNDILDFLAENYRTYPPNDTLFTDKGALWAYLHANGFPTVTNRQIEDLLYNLQVGLVDVTVSKIVSWMDAYRAPFYGMGVDVAYKAVYSTTFPILIGQLPYWMSRRLQDFDATVPLMVREGNLIGWKGDWIQYAVAWNPNPAFTYFVEIGKNKNNMNETYTDAGVGLGDGIPPEYYPMSTW